MPYIIRKNDDGKFCVYKQGDDGEPMGSSLGCHDTQEDADKQVSAIHTNEGEKKEKWMRLLSQAETGYVTLSATAGQACASCRWFRPNDVPYEGAIPADTCHLVDSYPETILPTGWCNRHEAKQAEEVKPAPMPVVIVEEAEEMDEIEKSQKPFNPLARAIRSLFRRDKHTPEFAVYKGMDGQDRWVARFTNSFEDRQREIIKNKALADYVDRVNAGFVPMPELWFWHIKGSRHGQADWLGHVGRFVVAVGTFDDTPMARRAKSYYRKNAGKISLSHGFLTPVWAEQKGADGVTTYDVVNTFEITTLPPGAAVASNPYTSFEEVRKMAVSQKQLTLLKEVLGEEAAARIISETEQQTKALEELGVRYKDFVDVSGETVVTKSDDEGLSEVFVDLLKAQNAQMVMQKAIADRQDKKDAELQTALGTISTLETRIKALEDELKLQPRASEADSTVTSDASIEQTLKEKQTGEKETFNPFPTVK